MAQRVMTVIFKSVLLDLSPLWTRRCRSSSHVNLELQRESPCCLLHPSQAWGTISASVNPRCSSLKGRDRVNNHTNDGVLSLTNKGLRSSYIFPCLWPFVKFFFYRFFFYPSFSKCLFCVYHYCVCICLCVLESVCFLLSYLLLSHLALHVYLGFFAFVFHFYFNLYKSTGKDIYMCVCVCVCVSIYIYIK